MGVSTEVKYRQTNCCKDNSLILTVVACKPVYGKMSYLPDLYTLKAEFFGVFNN